MRMFGFLALVLATSCSSSPLSNAGNEAAHADLRRSPIDVGEYTGLSDLTIDTDGHFWSAPERQRVVLRLNLTRDNPGLDDAPIPLEGVPDGADTEAVTWLAPGHFAMGTETQVDHRDSDQILMVNVEGGVARVTSSITMPYSLWNLKAKANDGIEGVCNAAGKLLASCETAGTTPEGQRYAPMGRYDMTSKTWTPFKLLLTSHIGKISALACRAAPGDRLEVLAIERHIGVSHLLRFTMPQQGTGQTIKPEVLVDFGRVIDAVPNFEGVAWSPQGDVFVLSDNDFGIVTGPTQMMVMPRH